MKKYIIYLLICYAGLLQAQPVCYDYDASGNRIARFDCNPVADCPCGDGGRAIGNPDGGFNEPTLLSQVGLPLNNNPLNPFQYGSNDEPASAGYVSSSALVFDSHFIIPSIKTNIKIVTFLKNKTLTDNCLTFLNYVTF